MGTEHDIKISTPRRSYVAARTISTWPMKSAIWKLRLATQQWETVKSIRLHLHIENHNKRRRRVSVNCQPSMERSQHRMCLRSCGCLRCMSEIGNLLSRHQEVQKTLSSR